MMGEWRRWRRFFVPEGVVDEWYEEVYRELGDWRKCMV